MLKFIYTNKVDENPITMDFFKAVDKYDLGENIREYCIEQLKEDLTIDNAFEIVARSYQIGCKDLQKAAFRFIMNPENREKIVKNDVWKDVAKESITACIGL